MTKRTAPWLTAIMVLSTMGCESKSEAETSAPPPRPTPTASATVSAAPEPPSDGLVPIKGEKYGYTVRMPEGTTVKDARGTEQLSAKTDLGEIDCFVNDSVSVYPQPKDMPQALREFTTMGYNMTPSWKQEEEGRFYAQLDKVKGAKVWREVTIHASLRTDSAKSLRLSCYVDQPNVETARKIVLSFKLALGE
ncbi:MAG: hypothetical protein KC731_05645 [Myxococcales bacterium]|nr:hypothetical protein [Myxococcales bacterium]